MQSLRPEQYFIPLYTSKLATQPQSIAGTIAECQPGLSDDVCKLIGEYVAEDFARGLTPLQIDRNRTKIQCDSALGVGIPDSGTGQDGPFQDASEKSRSGDTVHVTDYLAQAADVPPPFGLWSRQDNSYFDYSPRFGDRPSASKWIQARKNTPTLVKWKILFDQLYQTTSNDCENRYALLAFKTSLSSLDIDALLFYEKRVIPILSQPSRTADLLALHQRFQYKDFCKALYLTSHDIRPAELATYQLFRAAGYTRPSAVWATLHQRAPLPSKINLLHRSHRVPLPGPLPRRGKGPDP